MRKILLILQSEQILLYKVQARNKLQNNKYVLLLCGQEKEVFNMKEGVHVAITVLLRGVNYVRRLELLSALIHLHETRQTHLYV